MSDAEETVGTTLIETQSADCPLMYALLEGTAKADEDGLAAEVAAWSDGATVELGWTFEAGDFMTMMES